jgi:DNA-binding YbaB/EbfC family protein
MLKGMGNIASLMKQAQQMQGRMSEIQEELGRLRVEGTAGGGMVTVEANGQQRILAVKVDQSLFEGGDREMLEDLLTGAINQALDKAKQASVEEMAKVTGGLNIPGVGDALSKMGFGGTPSE